MTSLAAETRYTLGNLVPMLGRSATWTYRADAPGPKSFRVRVWSENGGEVIVTKTVQVVTPQANLAETDVNTTPGFPVRAPGSAFSITDTVQNLGEFEARSSTTRYYLSLDWLKNAGDLLLGGSRSVPALAVGAAHTGTATVTIPAATPINNYVVLACADDRGVVGEGDEGNNCTAAPGVVIVTRPDLLAGAVSNPPATVRRGGRFPVTDTTLNLGMLPSGPSKTRYHLRLMPLDAGQLADRLHQPGGAIWTGHFANPGLCDNVDRLDAVARSFRKRVGGCFGDRRRQPNDSRGGCHVHTVRSR